LSGRHPDPHKSLSNANATSRSHLFPAPFKLLSDPQGEQLVDACDESALGSGGDLIFWKLWIRGVEREGPTLSQRHSDYIPCGIACQAAFGMILAILVFLRYMAKLVKKPIRLSKSISDNSEGAARHF
jgi:hypothetical protein